MPHKTGRPGNKRPAAAQMSRCCRPQRRTAARQSSAPSIAAMGSPGRCPARRNRCTRRIRFFRPALPAGTCRMLRPPRQAAGGLSGCRRKMPAPDSLRCAAGHCWQSPRRSAAPPAARTPTRTSGTGSEWSAASWTGCRPACSPRHRHRFCRCSGSVLWA